MRNPDPATFLDPMRRAYDSEIEHLDQHLGVLFDGLRQRGLYDNAVILFTADHGEEFQDHKGWWHGQTVFDEIIRVPALLKLPKGDKAGTVNADFARHIDIAPTLLSFAGAKPAPAMPGKSLFAGSGAFANQDIPFVYAENDFENNILQTVRTRECKVIHANADNPRSRAPVEAYNVGKDPKEQTNLAGQNNSCETELDPMIGKMVNFIKGNAAEPKTTSHISSEQSDQLRGLGYLGNE
jgi:arylsulfatase A-like enzyme